MLQDGFAIELTDLLLDRQFQMASGVPDTRCSQVEWDALLRMALRTTFPSCNVCQESKPSEQRLHEKPSGCGASVDSAWGEFPTKKKKKKKRTGIEPYEEPPTAKQYTSDTQPNGPGSVKDGGHQFEMEMAALVGLRGLQRNDNFELFSNIDKDSEPHKEPPTAKQYTSDTQPNGPGSVKDRGHQFEMGMVASVGLCGLQRGDNFELFSNIDKDEAGNFDNLVYIAGDRLYFLQLEHADNTDERKLTKEELVPLLQTFLESYCAIKNRKAFRDIPIDNMEFIIYTNRELDTEMSQHSRQQREIDMIFKTCDKGEIFNFTPNKDKKIDVYTLLKNKVKKTKIIRRRCAPEMVKFLNKLIMATGQKGRGKLDELIKEEIRKDDAANVDDDMYSVELLVFKELVETWCRDTKEKMTATMFKNWLQEAKTASCTPVVSTLFERCTEKFARTGIHFSDFEISQLQAEVSNKRAVHLRSDAPTLCSILLLDCLLQSKCIFVNFKSLQSNKNMLLHAWLGGVWEWLIVYCDSTIPKISISNMCLEIFKVTQPIPSKKCVVILTTRSVPQIQGFSPINHKFRLEHLSKNSQKIVLSKKIDFQGRKVTMRSVLQRHGNVEHVLGPELVTDLITEGTAVNIGGKLHVNTGYYAHRFLERKVWLQLDVLRNPDSQPDVFVVNGMEVKDLVAIVPPGETVEYIDQQNIRHIDFTQAMRSRFIVLSEAYAEMCFLELSKKHRGRTLHWVQFNNGNLLWKKTHGGLNKLLNYIDTERTRLDKQRTKNYMERGTCEVSEESIWKLKERIVLVVAEPGMGKSSTTTHVAWHTKKRDPTSWVVRINWKKSGRKLHEINAATFNLDTLVEFLCSAAFRDSKYTDINRSLLKQALQSSGNVTVLMDGFDKLSPTSWDNALVILSGIVKTKVARVWVTSRPVQRDRLEKELSVTSFSMKKLSHQSQVQMLLELSVSKKFREKEKSVASINQLLMLVNQSVNDSNFIGSPLYIKMIATTYKLDIAWWISMGFSRLPRKIDPFCLYEEYVARKLNISLTEKERIDITNYSFLKKRQRPKKTLLEDFERCALLVTLPSPMLESLHNKKIQEQIQPFLSRVQAETDETGIVMNVVEGKPQFVHPAFAEYFTACWFSKNVESNRSVLEHILFDRRYRVVRDMFDRMMAKGCPLHCAVLNWDSESVETLLEEGCDVNAVDKGGRTVMHIIATHHSIFWDITNLVFHCGVSLANTDSVLQWTPLQYAIKSEKWFIVERLLESNVDRSGLDMIRQRAHDTDYIGPIIIHAATYGHMLLLEFLFSIGVNIHQASSSSFPSPLLAAVDSIQSLLDIARWIRLEFSRLPREIDSVCWHEKCVESKLHISLTEKERVDITSDSVLDNHIRLKNILLEDFERCALVATLPSPMLESLQNKKIQEQTQPFLGRVQSGKDKTGIVINVVEGKAQFIHPNFAEYFTACWFSKNFESNRSVMELTLFDRRYRVVRDMFDRMMTKGCPLHCAVLNCDSESVKTLLEEGCDANAVDKGGRTVMHIIATHHSIFWDITNLFFHCGVSLDNTDCVLQWTPLQYAIKSEKWFIVERLLERNVDRSGLDMIRQRVDDPDYIGPIIIHAVTYGYTLLLEFIRSIGVNIHQASSSSFPSPLLAAVESMQSMLDIARWIRLEFSRLPREIDSVSLYEKCVESKLHISLIEKERVDITNDSILDNHKRLKNILLEDFERCALVATLPSPMLESLHNKKIQEQIQPFLGRVQAGKDKTGIVINVVEGKAQFIHPNFAEYFTACWFSKNFESNRSVLEHILFDRRYSFVRDMFDRMMTKGCPLHCAVLNWDSESVKTLLEEGCDVNAVDKGGRTVMHIIATHHSIFWDITNLVFHCGVSLANTDCVLQWTPLQYAIKSEKWFFVERLLERNVDRSGLDMIRQRVHDTDYIGSIIIHAATYGHMLLLEFLFSIGNIHQASSMDFPSPLHAAVESMQSMQVVRWLIKHGADCNTRYSDGQTPLFYAVTEGSLDVVRVLVEEGGASVDVRDDCGRTAIDWANDYMSDPKNRDSIVWKGDEERLNETVKYLQERGCKQTSSVWRNNDA